MTVYILISLIEIREKYNCFFTSIFAYFSGETEENVKKRGGTQPGARAVLEETGMLNRSWRDAAGRTGRA